VAIPSGLADRADAAIGSFGREQRERCCGCAPQRRPRPHREAFSGPELSLEAVARLRIEPQKKSPGQFGGLYRKPQFIFRHSIFSSPVVMTSGK
jgi:hypothetical protein